MPSQIDAICLECPLESCDEGSLFCALRWVTGPNDAQMAFLKQRGAVQPATLKRRAYAQQWYRANRERILAAKKEQYIEAQEARREYQRAYRARKVKEMRG